MAVDGSIYNNRRLYSDNSRARTVISHAPHVCVWGRGGGGRSRPWKCKLRPLRVFYCLARR